MKVFKVLIFLVFFLGVAACSSTPVTLMNEIVITPFEEGLTPDQHLERDDQFLSKAKSRSSTALRAMTP